MIEGRVRPDPSRSLQRGFRRIHAERMQGLPFVNAAIGVEAVAFAPWKHYWLGTMLTPWAMNLMLTPREVALWRPLPVGEKRRYVFPAGEFDFIGAHDETMGEFLMCSLYSPVLQFADHETARATAGFARDALFDPDDTGSHGIDARLATPVSRRDLLHGRLGKAADEPRR